MSGREEYNPNDTGKWEKKPQPEGAVEVVRNARPQQILEIIRQMKQTALEYKATFSALEYGEQVRLLPRYDRIDGLISAIEAKAQHFAQAEAQFGSTGHQELVLFLGKDEQGRVVGLNLLELFADKKVVTVPTNLAIGEFHDPEVKQKYPPGSQIDCSNTSMSLLVLMQSQSRGLGKSIIRTSLETLKEMGVKAYSEILSTDTANLSSWLTQEGLIKDYCRIKLLREEQDSSAGLYVRVVSV